jgi:hypothetical protein
LPTSNQHLGVLVDVSFAVAVVTAVDRLVRSAY